MTKRSLLALALVSAAALVAMAACGDGGKPRAIKVVIAE
jgi:hypothetical protein